MLFHCFPFLQCSCRCKRSWKLKKSPVFTPMGAPISYRKTQLLKASSVVTSVTSWHHTMSPCHTFAHITPCITGRHDVNQKMQTRQNRAETCETRCWLRHVWADESEQSGYWRGASKRQELKPMEGKYSAAVLDCIKKLMSFQQKRMCTFSSSYPK